MITRQIPQMQTRAAFQPATLNEESRTVELTWSTGAQVRRFDWWEEKEFIEELSLDPAHVRMQRMDNGAPLLANHRAHDLEDVIGVVEKAWLENGTGRAQVKFSDREEVKPIIQDVKNGILRNISVGYKIYKLEEQEKLQDTLRVYLATDWEPMEISLVTIPADANAQVRSDTGNNAVTILNKPIGETMTDTVETITTETRADAPTESVKVPKIDVTAERAAATKEERQRVAEIRSFAKHSRTDEKTADDLIERGVSISDAKDAMLEKWSERVDAETSRSDVSVTTDSHDKFIEQGVAAIRAKAGLEKMDGANEMRGMRLTEMAKECLQRAGVSHKNMNEMEMVKRAFTTSTSDFPILLEVAMHKTLQGAYDTAGDTWSRFCSVGSVTDFRAHNRYRAGSFGNLDTLNELSEYKNKSIPDGEKASITATTKGNVINISRQTIINDDLGAFIGLSQMLGRAARRTIESDVYALLSSNPTMNDGIALFHADHGNLSGSGAAVSVAAIEAARVAMAIQTDVSGNDYLDLRPAIWLGGMGSGGTARVVNDAQYDPDTASKLQRPNMVRGLFSDVIDTPRITGNEWYLFASAMDAPVIEVAFLNGEQAPFLDSMEGFNVDGLQWKVRLDYGVAAIDYRGVYKDLGA